MRDYKWLHEYCLNRFGSAAELEAHLPVPKTPAQLRKISDDRYLSTMALRVFRAGLKHSLVDAKWPAFEEVFFKFDPEKVVLMSAEHLERLMQDARIIRHLGKLKSVPRNASAAVRSDTSASDSNSRPACCRAAVTVKFFSSPPRPGRPRTTEPTAKRSSGTSVRTSTTTSPRIPCDFATRPTTRSIVERLLSDRCRRCRRAHHGHRFRRPGCATRLPCDRYDR